MTVKDDMNKTLMDEVYQILYDQAIQRGVPDVPVVFELGNIPQLYSLRTDYFRPIIGGVQVQKNDLGIATLSYSGIDASGNRGYVVSGHFAPASGMTIWQPSTASSSYNAGSVSRVVVLMQMHHGYHTAMSSEKFTSMKRILEQLTAIQIQALAGGFINQA